MKKVWALEIPKVAWFSLRIFRQTFAIRSQSFNASLALRYISPLTNVSSTCSKILLKSFNCLLPTKIVCFARAWCHFAFTRNIARFARQGIKGMYWFFILNIPQQFAILTQPHRTFILESRPKPPFLRHGGRDDDASLSSAAAAPSCGGGSRQLGHSILHTCYSWILQLRAVASIMD